MNATVAISADAFVDCNYTSGSEFFVGTTRVCYEAVDEQDNKATCDFYVTVIGKWKVLVIAVSFEVKW